MAKTQNKPTKKAVKTAVKAAKSAAITAKAAKTVKKTADKTAPVPVKPVKKTVKSKPKRPAKAKRPTKKEELMIARRRQRVSQLKEMGVSVRLIAEQLTAEGFEHASVGTVQSDIDTILDNVIQNESLTTTRWRALLIQRLETQYFRVQSSMIRTDRSGKKYQEVNEEKERLLFSIHDRIDRMVGASKAEQTKEKAADALAKLIGVNPGELPREGKNED